MKILFFVVASLLLIGCGGSKPKGNPAIVILEPAVAKTCVEACDRVGLCWQKQYGEQDSSYDEATCETRCMEKTAEEQQAYAEAVGAETSCVKIMDM